MSAFVKALEQAEQDRALRRLPAPSEPTGAQADAAPETVPSDGRPAPPERPSGAAHGFEEHLVSLLAPTSFEAEQYRALRHLVEQLHKSSGLSVIAVSSPGVADGKTTTAINLAGALAQAPDARVLLIDGDLRGAAVAANLGLDERAHRGLVDAILDANLPLEAVAQARPDINLSVLPAGRLSSAPYEVLKSPRLGDLLAAARRQYDYVVLDTPPLVSFPDCRVIGKWVDGLLIVVSAHRTTRRLLEEALYVTEPINVVGLVFNGDDRHLSRNSYASRRSGSRNGRRASASDE